MRRLTGRCNHLPGGAITCNSDPDNMTTCSGNIDDSVNNTINGSNHIIVSKIGTNPCNIDTSVNIINMNRNSSDITATQ